VPVAVAVHLERLPAVSGSRFAKLPFWGAPVLLSQRFAWPALLFLMYAPAGPTVRTLISRFRPEVFRPVLQHPEIFFNTRKSLSPLSPIREISY